MVGMDETSATWMGGGGSDLVARRRIYGRIDREVFEIGLYIYRPERIERAKYRCQFKISWRDGERVKVANGVDSFQAMLWAMRLVFAELELLCRIWSIHLYFGERDARSGTNERSLSKVFDDPLDYWGRFMADDEEG